jgi:hypothetical protein
VVTSQVIQPSATICVRDEPKGRHGPARRGYLNRLSAKLASEGSDKFLIPRRGLIGFLGWPRIELLPIPTMAGRSPSAIVGSSAALSSPSANCMSLADCHPQVEPGSGLLQQKNGRVGHLGRLG